MKPKGVFYLMVLLFVCFVVSGADGAPVYKERPVAQGIMQKYVANQAIVKLAPEAIDRVGLQPQTVHGRKEAVIEATNGRIKSAALRQGLARLKAKHLNVTALSDAELIKRHFRTGRTGDFRFLREYALIEFGEGVDFFGIASDLRTVPGVLAAYPHTCTEKYVTPNDPWYDGEPNGINPQWHLIRISLPNVWNTYKGQNNPDIIVGVVEDCGVNLTHLDLAANVHPNSESGIFYGDTHGTMVAGVTCAVTNNGNAIAGASWNSRFLVSHTEGDPGWWAAIFAIADIAHLCDVLNYSWGGLDATWTDDFWTGVDNLGTIQIAAAGNENYNLDDPNIEHRPSEHPKVFPVGGTNISDFYWYDPFTGQGTNRKLGMLYAPGSRIITTTGTENNSNLITDPVRGVNGTSFSAPLVAGVAALMRVKNPNLTTETCRSILLNSADNVLLNPSTWEYGKRLNAERALDQTPSGAPKIAIAPVPEGYTLEQNFPNPFNPVTSISFALPVPTSCAIRIYNLQGQEVRVITLEGLNAGRHSIRWDGLDGRGVPVSSGVYLYELRTQTGFFATRKLLFLK